MLSLYLSMCCSEDGRAKMMYVYNNYRPLMIRAAYKYVHDMDLASDMVHDAMVNLAKNAHKLKVDNEIALRTYLCTIAKNAAIDFVRKQRKVTIVDFESVEYMFHDETVPSAFEMVIDDLEYNNIINCIKKLPDTYKDAMYLRYVCDMSEADIADTLGIKYDNVSARIHRGKKLLKEMLEEQKNEK